MKDVKITANIARTMAEQLWGRGGTHSYRTNRKGVWYYSCSGHGGYVVDPRALSETERAAIQQHNRGMRKAYWVYEEHSVKVVRQGEKVLKMISSLNTRSVRYQWNADYGVPVIEELPLWFFEEDNNWAYLERYTDIHANGVRRPTEDQLQKMIISNDRMKKELQEYEDRRNQKDPDLIVSALQCKNGKYTTVATADDKYHIVSDYNEKKPGIPYHSNLLSRYIVVESDVGTLYN